MPLTCDCYGGCWGDHAKDWPKVAIPPSMGHYELADKAGIPYGSYVKIGDNLHVETIEYQRAAGRALYGSEADNKPAQSMTFQRFSALNGARCRDGFKHDPASWSASDWMVATFGELGEAANVLKKLNRERDGIKGNTATATVLREQLARELADTFIYLDLMSQALGIDLESAVRRTFDAKSREIGYPHLIDKDAA